MRERSVLIQLNIPAIIFPRLCTISKANFARSNERKYVSFGFGFELLLVRYCDLLSTNNKNKSDSTTKVTLGKRTKTATDHGKGKNTTTFKSQKKQKTS